MQTSGTFPQLSDGNRKAVVGSKAPAAKPPAAPKPPAKAPTMHRRGGYQKHAGGKNC